MDQIDRFSGSIDPPFDLSTTVTLSAANLRGHLLWIPAIISWPYAIYVGGPRSWSKLESHCLVSTEIFNLQCESALLASKVLQYSTSQAPNLRCLSLIFTDGATISVRRFSVLDLPHSRYNSSPPQSSSVVYAPNPILRPQLTLSHSHQVVHVPAALQKWEGYHEAYVAFAKVLSNLLEY